MLNETSSTQKETLHSFTLDLESRWWLPDTTKEERRGGKEERGLMSEF